MSLRITSTSVVGATIILAFGAAAALAQKQPKSTKRIPITKEAAGEVVRDTVIRTDTLMVTNTVYRTDTLWRTNVRVDSVMLPPPPIPVHLPNGFYFGVAGGSSSPDGSIFIPNSVGYIGQAALGWQRAKNVLGGRISTTYTGLGQDTRFVNLQDGRGKLWTMSTDLKAQVPIGRIFGRTPRLNAYGIGGWTYTWSKDVPFRLDRNLNDVFINGSNGVVVANGVTTVNGVVINPGDVFANSFDRSWHGNSGWDAGGGLSLLWGRSEIFIESRVMGFKPGGCFGGNNIIIANANGNSVTANNICVGGHASQARQVPLVFGYNFY